MRKALFAPLLVALAFAAPGTGGTTATLEGVVIARMPAQGELVLASAGGCTTTLRAPSLPSAGTILRTSAFKLSDGTSAVKSMRVAGNVRHASFRGVLVRTVGSTSFFAAGRSVVVVHAATRSVASARSSRSSLSPGEAAEIEVTIAAGGALHEDSVTPTPSDDANEVMLQVTIAAVVPATATTPGSITLTINGQTLVIPLPAGTVLPPAFAPNATVGVKIEFKQPGVNDNRGRVDDDQGDDDDHGATTTTTTTATVPASGGTTTTTTTSSSGHRDDHGDGHGRDDGGHGGGGND
jgi:hypothetical protein